MFLKYYSLQFGEQAYDCLPVIFSPPSVLFYAARTIYPIQDSLNLCYFLSININGISFQSQKTGVKRRDGKGRGKKGNIHSPATATLAVRLTIDPASPKDASHW